jgi:hypothetical protein
MEKQEQNKRFWDEREMKWIYLRDPDDEDHRQDIQHLLEKMDVLEKRLKSEEQMTASRSELFGSKQNLEVNPQRWYFQSPEKKKFSKRKAFLIGITCTATLGLAVYYLPIVVHQYRLHWAKTGLPSSPAMSEIETTKLSEAIRRRADIVIDAYGYYSSGADPKRYAILRNFWDRIHGRHTV